MPNMHPTYPNPTIQEAVCEIHFGLANDAAPAPSLIGDFFKAIQTEFPTMEPSTVVGMQFQIGPTGVAPKMLPAQTRMRFRHHSRQLLLQLSSNILTVNVLPKYPGWATMLGDIQDAWSRARAVIRPSKIGRIGLRYINRVDRTHPEEAASKWVAASDYVSRYVLSSRPGFLSRLEAHPSEHDRIIVTLGELEPNAERPAGSIMLDIDCIVHKDFDPFDDSALSAEVGQLHNRAWDVFSASITSGLRELLEGQPQ